MGKYAKKTQMPKVKATNAKSGLVQKIKTKKLKKKGKRKNAPKHVQARDLPEPKDGDAMIDSAGAAAASASDRSAAEKLVSFLGRARTDRKALDAVRKAVSSRPVPEALGAALGHCAGRGLTECVRLLVEASAPLDWVDTTQPAGRVTPLQLAASRGHVNVCRALVQAGANRAGAAEAVQDLAQYGHVLGDEKRAIQALLGVQAAAPQAPRGDAVMATS
mmetsp:Transcript_33226/g.93239  ORF Transcript_33226/g.93239 Transcript_33226/m.93239 type:complete len:219 (-) Transcript_33226:242-898(-)